MRKRTILGLAVGALLLAGCGSSGGLDDPAVFRQSLGRATYQDFRNGVDKILVMKYAYTIQRFEENYNTVWMETEWHSEDLLPAEREMGVRRARSRITIDGRRGVNDTFRLRFTINTEYQMEGEQAWQELPLPEEREEEYRRVLSDLDLELRSGVRIGGPQP